MFDDIFSHLDTIQYTNVADRRTDGRTPADSKDRANAYIASRVKTKLTLHTYIYIAYLVMASFQSEYG